MNKPKKWITAYHDYKNKKKVKEAVLSKPKLPRTEKDYKKLFEELQKAGVPEEAILHTSFMKD